MTAAALSLSSRFAPRRAVALVFLPFAAGYYLTYLFRTINALIATRLMSDLGLGAGDLGLLTSVFFLSLAAVQLPLGVMLDRYGPRRIQVTLLPVASLGAALFAMAEGFYTLAIGRALIGIGVAGSLMSGLKAIILWFPRERIPLANGCFVMLGALGAVTATAPAESILASIGWRGLFELLAITSAACALLVYAVVPEPRSPLLFVPEPASEPRVSKAAELYGLAAIYRDRRLWRLAPLSTTCIGGAWALHGLWAAPWLRDVASLDQPAIVQHLFVMAVAACAGALLLGIGGAWFGRHNKSDGIFAITAALLIAAQLALVLDWPVPTALVWAVVAGVGAATVLSFAILAEHFPSEVAGRANAALNLLHVGGAFVLQSGIGVVIGQWTPDNGRYPAVAYHTAFAFILALQIAALLWFITPDRSAGSSGSKMSRQSAARDLAAELRFASTCQLAANASDQRLASMQAKASRWRFLALGTGAVAMLLAVILVASSGLAVAVTQRDEVTKLDRAQRTLQRKREVRPSDAQIAYLLGRFVEDVRSLSTDPVVVRSRWVRAFAATTPGGAEALDRFVRESGRLTHVGQHAVIAEMTAILRISENSFEAHWVERAYEQGALTRTEMFTGAVMVAYSSSSAEHNPFGVYVDAIAIAQHERK